ncbi:DNA/RNA non-specific endonuclease [Enterococcus avium]|uniref:DNA/RNA non-specific endonuclease n=1 Tax=Enterococcus avium TaxID=33945 RepID=UPI00232D1E2A|nr:DNA/RNA non-specific endonuclease [Enterococcus avium]MDB1729506.1 DNA/RNA non-specific endonuclease [Enterococcus avium]MDB1733582.1 DNA/RNA non-specific endonuclease [Enterococcus avium]
MKKKLLGLVITIIAALSYGGLLQPTDILSSIFPDKEVKTINVPSKGFNSLSDFKEYTGDKVYSINNNSPAFTSDDLSLENGTWQTFSDLDHLNRVGAANALLHKSSMPTAERGDIQNVYPSGWNQKKLSDGSWLYNRSHLIGYQLTGENDNWKNLFTGTAQMNQTSMLEYENQIASYLRNTNNHVRYRVTPLFIDQELVCRGIQLEAQSIEDNALSFNVFIYNVSDGADIDYSTGHLK